jgi:hypothetical protein
MSENIQPTMSQNPLASHFRQPVIYLKLPSGGSYWPEGSINLPLNGEIPILAMSTKDEIILKTPDALLNGQGVVNVIESCCPSIKDAWLMPSIDVDAVIIAIRIASYGNEMEFGAVCPKCSESHDYAIDLSVVLDSVVTPVYNKVDVAELKIKLKPQAYFNVNKNNMIAFEEQQILRTIRDLDDNPEQAQSQFNDHLSKLIDLNVTLLATSTDYIETADGNIVTDIKYFEEFYKNCDTKIVKKVREVLEEISTNGGLKPVNVSCNSCQHEFPVRIEFDFSSFFGKGS